MWVYLLVHKSDALHAYLSFEAWMKTQHGYRIKCLCSDQGGECLSNKFSNYLTTHGIEHWLTMHDTLEQNGVAKRLNCTLLERVHAMLHSAQLPKNLWGEALAHNVWLKNHTSTQRPWNRPCHSRHSPGPNLTYPSCMSGGGGS